VTLSQSDTFGPAASDAECCREDTRISSLRNVPRSRLTARPSVVFVALRLTLSNPSLRRTCPLLPGVVGYFGWFGKLRIRVALRLRPGLLYLAEVSCRKPPDRGTDGDLRLPLRLAWTWQNHPRRSVEAKTRKYNRGLKEIWSAALIGMVRGVPAFSDDGCGLP
jgi:hypothetical protein